MEPRVLAVGLLLPSGILSLLRLLSVIFSGLAAFITCHSSACPAIIQCCVEEREKRSDPDWTPTVEKKHADVGPEITPLGTRGNTSPERPARRPLAPPQPTHVVIEMEGARDDARQQRIQRAWARASRNRPARNDDNKEN